MQLGNWKSYDELERHLTIEELYELYGGIMENRIEDFKNMARANGAKLDDEDGEQDDGEGWQNVMNQVNELKGQKPEKRKTENKIGGLFKINQI